MILSEFGRTEEGSARGSFSSMLYGDFFFKSYAQDSACDLVINIGKK